MTLNVRLRINNDRNRRLLGFAFHTIRARVLNWMQARKGLDSPDPHVVPPALEWNGVNFNDNSALAHGVAGAENRKSGHKFRTP